MSVVYASNPLIQDLVIEGIKILEERDPQQWWGLPTRDAVKQQRTGIGISQLAGCPRQLWYTDRQTPPSNHHDTVMNVVWWYGQWFENLVIRALEAVGVKILLRSETVYLQGIPGHIDGLIDAHSHPRLKARFTSHRYWLLEIKTIKHYKVNGLTRWGVEQEMYNYSMQMQGYLLAIGYTFPEYASELGGAIFFAGDKGFEYNFSKGVAVKPFYEEVVHLNSKEAAQLAKQVRATLNNDTLPNRPYNILQSFPCDYCSHRDLCWSEGEVDIDLFQALREDD